MQKFSKLCLRNGFPGLYESECTTNDPFSQLSCVGKGPVVSLSSPKIISTKLYVVVMEIELGHRINSSEKIFQKAEKYDLIKGLIHALL